MQNALVQIAGLAAFGAVFLLGIEIFPGKVVLPALMGAAVALVVAMIGVTLGRIEMVDKGPR